MQHAQEEKRSYQPGGAMNAFNVASMRCREASYIIYSVLSPGGPSVMAVLCSIKITTGAPHPVYTVD